MQANVGDHMLLRLKNYHKILSSKSRVPPYIPDVAPNDCPVFQQWKEHLSGIKLSLNTYLKTAGSISKDIIFTKQS